MRHLAAIPKAHFVVTRACPKEVKDFSENHVDNLKRCFHHMGVNQRLAEAVGWSLQKLIHMRSRHIVSRRSTIRNTSVPNLDVCR